MKNMLLRIGNYWRIGKVGKLIIICLCIGGSIACASILPNIISTPTPTITNTPIPTDKPLPTKTSSPKPTSTATSTPIPPATQTAQALILAQTRTAQDIALTQTQVAYVTTATRQAYLSNMTATAQAIALTNTKIAQDITATRESYESKVTATARAISNQATLVASYEDIEARELISYAEQHKGEKVKIRIRIFNVVNDLELQGYFAGTYDTVYVIMKTSFSGLYENDYIYVYGVVGGDYCYDTQAGGTNCNPILEDAWFQK